MCERATVTGLQTERKLFLQVAYFRRQLISDFSITFCMSHNVSDSR